MKVRITTLCAARSATRCSQRGRDGSHVYPVRGFAEHLDCHVVHRLGAKAER
jgi:hypothetical protein